MHKDIYPQNYRINMDNQEQITSCINHEFFSLKSFVHTLDLIDKEISRENNYILEYIPTKIFISAISLELIIKLFYLLDKNEIHEKSHDIKNLFDKLNSESQKLIEDEFKKTVIKPAKDFENKIEDEIYIPNFNEILFHNEKIVMDFKYDSKLGNGSIVSTNFIKNLFIEIEQRIKTKNNN